MNEVVETMTGMNTLTDQVIASDLLFSAKSGIKTYAAALSESATPEVRKTLKRQLNDAISSHERIFSYMQNKGYYNAYDMNEQIQLDLKNADKALRLE